MTVKTLKYIEVMGATGAGIKKRSDVDKSRQNQFITKWSMYLFVTPTQLKINFRKTVEIEGAPGNDLGGYASEEWDIERQTPERRNDSKNVGLVPSEDGKHADDVRKRQGTENEKAPRKKKQKKDEFAEIVQAKEVTRQKEMDVAKARAEKDIMRAKIKLAKIELERKKLRDQRERRRDQAARKHIASMASHLHHSTRLQSSNCPYYSLQQFMATTMRLHITLQHHLSTLPSMMTLNRVLQVHQLCQDLRLRGLHLLTLSLTLFQGLMLCYLNTIYQLFLRRYTVVNLIHSNPKIGASSNPLPEITSASTFLVEPMLHANGLTLQWFWAQYLIQSESQMMTVPQQ